MANLFLYHINLGWFLRSDTHLPDPDLIVSDHYIATDLLIRLFVIDTDRNRTAMGAVSIVDPVFMYHDRIAGSVNRAVYDQTAVGSVLIHLQVINRQRITAVALSQKIFIRAALLIVARQITQLDSPRFQLFGSYGT